MNPIARALAIASRKTNTAPTEAQVANDAYRKGVFDWRGDLKIAIENPKGSERSGIDKGGKKWSVRMPAAYGEVRKSVGADGDAVDAYIGSSHDSPTVWVIDQIDAHTGKWDEHKCFLDFKDKDQVLETYSKAFSDGKAKDRIGSVTQMPVDAFVAWVKHGRTKNPLGDLRQKFASGGAVPGFADGGTMALANRYASGEVDTPPVAIDRRGEGELRSYEFPWYDRLSHGLADWWYGDKATAPETQWVKKLTGPENPFNIPAQVSEGQNVAQEGLNAQSLPMFGAGMLESAVALGMLPAALRPVTRGLRALPEAEPFVSRAYRGSVDPEDAYTAHDRPAYWASDKPEVANEYAGNYKGYTHTDALDPDVSGADPSNVTSAEVRFERPLVVDAQGRQWHDIPYKTHPLKSWSDSVTTDWLADLARRRGHDGLVVKNVYDDGPLATTFAAVRPGTVKSPLTGEWIYAVPPAVGGAASAVGSNSDQETPQFASGGAALDNTLKLAQRYYTGDLAPDPEPSDFERTLDSYPPLKSFEPFRPSELRGTGPGESRDPRALFGNTTGERPSEYLQPAYEMASPAMGGYGMGQGVGEVAKDTLEGEYGNAALAAIPLAIGAMVPGPDGKPMRIQREIDSRGFYSPSLEASKVVPQQTGTVQQMTSMLLKAGAKPKELEAVGFHRAFPDPNAKVNRADIEQYLRDNRVQLGEARSVTDPSDIHRSSSNMEPRYESYSTPGGIPGSYREVVTTLPTETMNYDKFLASLKQKYNIPPGEGWGKYVTPEERAKLERMQETGIEEAEGVGTYTSSHWPGITNPLLHYRTKDFEIPSEFVSGNRPEQAAPLTPSQPSVPIESGSASRIPLQEYGRGDLESASNTPRALTETTNLPSKVRVLDEMQSDWAQRARDQGTRDPQAVAQWQEKLDALNVSRDAVEARMAELAKTSGQPQVRHPVDVVHFMADEGHPEAQALAAEWNKFTEPMGDLNTKLNAAKHGVPNAPYISNTSDWVDLGLKQALIDAAKDPSVSRLAWAPGKVQADRYNLAREVHSMEYDPTKQRLYYAMQDGRTDATFVENPAALDGIVGKEVADKLRASGPYKGAVHKNTHYLEFEPGTVIGGEGMKSFYGDMTPEGYQSGIVGTRLQKLVKGLDPEAARVEPHELSDGKRHYDNVYYEDMPDGRFAVIGTKGRNRDRNPPETLGVFKTEQEAQAFAEKKDRGGFDYPSIPITPAMRERILKEGLPLFLTPLGLGLAGEGMQGEDTGDPVQDMLRYHYGDDEG